MTKNIILTKANKNFVLTFKWIPPADEFYLKSYPILKKRNISVKFPKGFWIQETPINFALYEFLYGKPYWETYKEIDNSDYPLYGISVQEMEDILIQLNQISNSLSLEINFDIPTIAEWEYALYGNNNYKYFYGDSLNELPLYAWLFNELPNGKPQKIKLKKPNVFGLFDMVGNIGEYCYGIDIDTNPNEISRINYNETKLIAVMGNYSLTFDEEFSIHRVAGLTNWDIEPFGFRLLIR